MMDNVYYGLGLVDTHFASATFCFCPGIKTIDVK